MERVRIPVYMDAPAFFRFASYDAFAVRKMARRPALFFSILAAFALFAKLSGRPGSRLIFTVLMLVATLLPLAYFARFFLQVRRTARALRLTPPRLVYTLDFDGEAVTITSRANKENSVTLRYESLYRVYVHNRFLYVYQAPQKAFVVPIDNVPAAKDLYYRMASFLPTRAVAGRWRK